MIESVGFGPNNLRVAGTAVLSFELAKVWVLSLVA